MNEWVLFCGPLGTKFELFLENYFVKGCNHASPTFIYLYF
jgi:hypothetical protein